ncbi:CRISPR-associated endonuclease Cas2 [Tannockella kyphosi]|uniref:CRISPR-associated endonuclease Cas2 n=1 Tax=Tannockella kyphosi TaxID=2899121 RepID=UPI002010CFC9|nr:CRISPR-associated endonuclease Cas2 [Tannockella kyphosi]
MRIIVFFDLPTLSYQDIKAYTKFRKFLIKDGFIMMQESVYIKLALNNTVASAQINRIKTNKPPDGLVQVLTITEKQFSKMEYVVGFKSTEVVDTDERLIVL